jgi:hypothetical protein
VSRVTSGYGIEAVIVYPSAIETRSDCEQNQRFAMVSAPVAIGDAVARRIIIQLICEQPGTRFAKRRLVMKQDEAVIKKQICVPSIGRTSFDALGNCRRHQCQAGQAGNFHQIMTARSRQATTN